MVESPENRRQILIIPQSTIYRRETVCGRYADGAYEQIFRFLAIDFCGYGDHVVKKTQVKTHVPHRTLLPAYVLQRKVFRNDHIVSVIHATAGISVVLVVGTDRSVTVYTI